MRIDPDEAAHLGDLGAVRLVPTIVHDPARLAALDGTGILDTASEPGFEGIVRLTARLCAVPVALVSFVAAERQWFKARVGFPPCETDLNASVCKFVLSEPDLLVIPDLTADPRTAGNPLVTGEPHIRFYAGAPLRTPEGLVLGSLCAIDTVPRLQGLTAEQADDLRTLADQVMAQMALRRAVEQRDEVLDRQHTELRRARRIDVLAKASAALLTATDPAAVLDPILAASADALGFDRSYTYDVWRDGRHLRLTHSFNATAEVQAYLRRMPYGAPLCGLVAESRQPLVLADLQRSTEPGYQTARSIGLDAYAGFPLSSRGSLRGVISFASTRAPAFDAEALSFFETVARLMSAVYERQDADASLRESDARSRRAQAAGRIGTYEVDVASGLMTVSDEFARLHGRPPTGLYSSEAFETLVLPEDRHLVSTDTAREAGTVIADVEYRIRRADDGVPRWIARHASLARDEAGRVTRMFGTVQDVTDRRETQAALRASEELFRTITETIEAAFAIVEVRFDADDRPVDYRFVEANPAFERQAGVNLRGKWVTEFAPDLERFWFETYGRVARTGEPATFENYAEAFKRWFDVRAVRVGRPEERQIAILFSDITARKQAEAALRASEALARENIQRVQLALAAGAIIGTWHWDLPSDRFTVDEAFARSFGLDPALGREGIPLAQIVATVHPDDQAGLADAINEAVARGGAYAHQYRVRRADGHYYWIEANGRVDRAEDGTPLSFPGVLLDVEERRAAQEALLASETRFRALVTAGAQTVYRMSPDWQEMRTLVGAGFLADTEAPSVRWLDHYLDPADRPDVLAAIEDAITRKGTFELEHRVRRADGTFGWTLSRAVPILDGRGEIQEWFGAASDITERKEADVRRAALLELGDRLRGTDDPNVMAYAAAEIMGRTLGATRAGYGSVEVAAETVMVGEDWTAPGHASVRGLHRFRDYGTYLDDLRRDAFVTIADVAEDSRTRDGAAAMAAIRVRTLIVAPLVEHGVLVALLFVHDDRPRAWSVEDVAFVRNVADRTRAGIARVRAEAEQRVLNEELSHRLKNTLAMVISIAGQTLRSVPDRAPVKTFEQRIHALSRAHDVLLRQNWKAAPAKEVVRAVLSNAGHGDRIEISGPELDFGPRATLSLSLLLHELATNAVKYGALSVPEGRVVVARRLTGEGGGREAILDWIERGGPVPTPPATSGRKGFGSRLIQMGLVGTGGVDLRFPASGFQATMRAPLVQLQQS